MLNADIYRDIYAQQHRISIQTTPIPDPDLTLPFKGTYVNCKTTVLIPDPLPPIDKEESLRFAINVIDEMTECLEYNNGDFVYSICPKKNVIQRFSTDLKESEDLTELEWKIIQKIRYKLGKYSVIPPTNVPYFNLDKPAGSYLSTGLDGTFRLKQLWGSGDYCEEITQKRQIIITSPLLCNIDGFTPREYKNRGDIECFVDKALLENLDSAERKRWRMEDQEVKENFVLFS
ncbi:hypothetical protein HDV04_000301 [Boothiomyces sp. JEL0838]|nr:hypothetical protein HDV04_000301 [Boothiomyces sp. JEL0838]